MKNEPQDKRKLIREEERLIRPPRLKGKVQKATIKADRKKKKKKGRTGG